ncbi:MAG: hypothetical protein IT324_22085 [Anaerolineae bacterium]|nr:hypothetical protein [Anaerolineae bacterium]
MSINDLLLIVSAVVIGLTGFTPSSARSEAAQGTLTYEPAGISLTNTGDKPLDIGALIFVRDGKGRPARFEARSWGIRTLQPGECVQVRSPEFVSPRPDGCQRLVRWLSTGQSGVMFWQDNPDGHQFRVVNGSADLTTCAIRAGRCTITISPEQPIRIEGLALTYTATTLWINNDTTTPVRLTHLLLCDISDANCVRAYRWQPANFTGILEPDACLVLTTDGATDRPPCNVTASLTTDNAFWTRSFIAIAPITARLTTCPAVINSANRAQRCMISR